MLIEAVTPMGVINDCMSFLVPQQITGWLADVTPLGRLVSEFKSLRVQESLSDASFCGTAWQRAYAPIDQPGSRYLRKFDAYLVEDEQ